MEFRVPHEIVYETPRAVPIGDVIDSLVATERTAQQIGDLLEGCIDGLLVDRVEVSVQHISQDSPLREIFVFSLIVAFQDDLEKEVPSLLEDLFGKTIPDQYDTVVTVCVLILIFYGADYLYRRFHGRVASGRIRRQFNGLVADLAKRTNCSEDKIRKILGEKYGQSRLRLLGASALRFFRPSKHQGNARIRSGKRTINRSTIAEVPGDIAEEALEPAETSHVLKDVNIEIHAQDVDRPRQGWAAVIPGVIDRRIRMYIMPPVTPDSIYTRRKIKGDVVVISQKQEDGNYEPIILHLIRVSG